MSAPNHTMAVDVEHLRRWKEEATEVLIGMQELGKALGLPLGTRITGTLAAETAERLKAERDEAHAALDRVRRLHSQDTSLLLPGEWCPACGDAMPCSTIRAMATSNVGDSRPRQGQYEAVPMSNAKASERALCTLTNREVSDLRAVHTAGSSRQLLNLVDRIIRARAEAGR